MRQKQIFKLILAAAAILLLTLPFLVSLNEFLTKIVEKFTLYTWMQSIIVPVEVKMVVFLVRTLGIDVLAYTDGFGIDGAYLKMTWNCIGWQSMLLLAISFYIGLGSAKFKKGSILETVGIGILGTFLVNFIRLTFIVILYKLSHPIYAVVYHDYLAALTTIVWLFFFWWLSYKYLLIKEQN